MTQNCWAIICPEKKAPGVWAIWLRERCVAVGWPPSRYHISGDTSDKGWAWAREYLPMVAVGDIVIPYLMENRFGTPGRVTSVAYSDEDWNPTVAKGGYRGNYLEAELGRRIHVEWMSDGTPPVGKIATVPRKMRHANGEVRRAIELLKQDRFGRFTDILKDRRNWRDYHGNTAKAHLTATKNQEPAAGKILEGDKLYLERARKAFPILVRQALARQRIFYCDLAEELKMANPQNLNYVLGSIGRAIEALATEWGEEIPPLQCVVVNKKTRLPGEGVAWFVRSLKNFDQRTPEEQKRILDYEVRNVFDYAKWERVLGALKLEPLVDDPNVDALIAKARQGGGVGECEDHRKLKNFVASNPNVIGLSGFSKGKVEHCFPSADRIDIVFQDRERWVGVEVKGPSSSDADITRGLFQTVKYIALHEAELKSKSTKGRTQVILVLSRTLPPNLKRLKNLLGVKVIDGVVVPEERDNAPDAGGSVHL